MKKAIVAVVCITAAMSAALGQVGPAPLTSPTEEDLQRALTVCARKGSQSALPSMRTPTTPVPQQWKSGWESCATLQDQWKNRLAEKKIQEDADDQAFVKKLTASSQ